MEFSLLLINWNTQNIRGAVFESQWIKLQCYRQATDYRMVTMERCPMQFGWLTTTQQHIYEAPCPGELLLLAQCLSALPLPNVTPYAPLTGPLPFCTP